jgi:endonuclease/exonuclease/phosphatase family metal-dependent hydrolase
MAAIELVTLNCFGVLLPSTGRRLRTLARELNAGAADVVCLQEVQAHLYRRLLVQACASYPHSVFEPFLHAPKGGLLTLARHGVARSGFALYDQLGAWLGLSAADRALRKGALQAELRVGDQRVIVINTHLSANYRGDWQRESAYTRVERAQLQQLAGIVAAQPADAIVLVAGDFNVPRGSALYREFIAASGLHDPLAGDLRPTYRLLPGMPAQYAQPIDFVLLRAPALPALRARADLCFATPLPLVGGGQGFLSDHVGLRLRVEWGQGEA